MSLQKALINGVYCVVDSSAPTVPLTDMTGEGGDLIAHNAEVLSRLCGWILVTTSGLSIGHGNTPSGAIDVRHTVKATGGVIASFGSDEAVGVNNVRLDLSSVATGPAIGLQAREGTTARNLSLQSGGGNVTLPDNGKHVYGTGGDAEIYYDGANLVINPRAVGTGYVLMPGGLLLGDATLAAPLVIQTGVKTADAVLMYFGSAGASPLVLAVGIVGSATATAQGISLSATEPGVSDDRPMVLQRYGGRVGVGIDNPTEKLEVNGNVKPTGYKSSDGTAGATADVAVAKVGGGTRTLHFKNGLYTNHTDS